VLSQLNQKLQQIQQNRGGIEERTKRLRSEFSQFNRQENEARGGQKKLQETIDRLNAEMDELEKKRKQLITDISNAREEFDSTKNAITEIERKRQEYHRSITKLERELEKVAEEEIAVDEKRARHQQELNSARATAIPLYLDDLNGKLFRMVEQSHNRKCSKEQFERFKKARHENEDVAKLCESRDEWQRILKSIMVPAVKESVERELATIESEIKKQFPGALEFSAGSGGEEFIADLYYYNDSKDRCVILLPIKGSECPDEETNKDKARSSFVISLFLQLCQQLAVKPETGRFFVDGNDGYYRLVLADRKNPLPDLKENYLIIELPDGEVATLVMATLPSEIMEAING